MLVKIKTLGFGLLALLFSQSLFSQATKSIPKSVLEEKLVVFKIDSYSVGLDKLVQKEFAYDQDLAIISTCIPAGILAFESKNVITPQLKFAIQNRMKKANETILCIELQCFTLFDVEEECFCFREN